MTPQALSIALKKLEDELGIPLLKRSYKGAVLTPDGIWLVELAETKIGFCRFNGIQITDIGEEMISPIKGFHSQ